MRAQEQGCVTPAHSNGAASIGTHESDIFTGQPTDPSGFLTFFNLGGTTQLNPRITIDETPGTATRAWLYNFQAIQSYRFSDGLTLENNTLFMFQNSDNLEGYYYADESNGSYTVENKTDCPRRWATSIKRLACSS